MVTGDDGRKEEGVSFTPWYILLARKIDLEQAITI